MVAEPSSFPTGEQVIALYAKYGVYWEESELISRSPRGDVIRACASGICVIDKVGLDAVKRNEFDDDDAAVIDTLGWSYMYFLGVVYGNDGDDLNTMVRYWSIPRNASNEDIETLKAGFAVGAAVREHFYEEDEDEEGADG